MANHNIRRTTPQFSIGQRWVSNNDVSLGLGVVKSIAGRTVQVDYPATGQTRIYAQLDAPLTRVRFNVGDTVTSIEGQRVLIAAVESVAGTLRYRGHSEGVETLLHEADLCDDIVFNLPQDKLFTGQIDDNKWFELRAATLRHSAEQQTLAVFGLQGARISLIPHQLYVADQVSRRMMPRVLLADEVGLGKTIEAGLILHRLILTGRVKRALVVVPEPLLHQWLVELLRRFNLRFSLIDHQAVHVRPVIDDGSVPPAELDDNPFKENPLVLCSLNFASQDTIAPLVSACDWDMLIVDEAHHLQWRENEASQEYRCVEQWATQIKSVLLLTATPEQLGEEGHFARLRLLDPARFYSLEKYLRSEKAHAATVELVEALLNSDQLDPTLAERIAEQLGQQASRLKQSKKGSQARHSAIQKLVDQYGTGRLLFRNTRANVAGFAKRVYRPTTLADETAATWLSWLAEKIRQLSPEKILLICASATTASQLARQLDAQHGLVASLFHEAMRIIDRDRAAAWFADPDNGSRVLICSEIGSEGRNFQFLRHIILFDLPDNPDLLEQRIGRLDRIGQRHDIQIHVPAAANSRTQRLRDWYHQALDAFQQSCVTGQFVQSQLGEQWLEYLEGKAENETAFVARCRNYHHNKLQQLQAGRNRLLEINACRMEVAEPLIEVIAEQENSSQLTDYLEQAFDCYGVDIEEHALNSWIVRPSDHLQIEQYPELPEAGMTITTRRDTALSREDMQFVSWEHPLVRATFDLVLNGDRGSVSICALKIPQLSRNILIEALFETQCVAPVELGVERYLPAVPLRLLVDQKGRDYSQQLPIDSYQPLLENIHTEAAMQMIDMTRKTLKAQIDAVEKLAGQKIAALRQTAKKTMHDHLDDELTRLQTLQKRNPMIRQREIDQLQQRITALSDRLGHCTLGLSALRVIYAH